MLCSRSPVAPPSTKWLNFLRLLNEDGQRACSSHIKTCPDALEAAVGAGKLEWPEERRDLLEVGAGGVDLVDDVLNGNDAVLAEVGLDDLVVGKRQALLVDLAVSSLVDELTDG